MLLLLIMAAVDPVERCAAFGDQAILGDLDKYKQAQYLVKKDAPSCILFHAAMVKVKLAEKGGAGYLRSAIQLLQKIQDDGPIGDWAKIRQLELALRLQEPDLAPDMSKVPKHLPSVERRWLMDTSLLGYQSPDDALAAHEAHKFPRGRDRLSQIADMFVMLEDDDSRKPALLAELYREYPDAWLTPKEWPEKKLGPMPHDVLLDRLTIMTGRHANQSVLLQTAKALKQELPPEVHCQVLYHRGVAFRKLRSYQPALRTLSDALSTCKAAQQTEAVQLATKKAWFTFGQVQMIAQPFEEAKPTLTEFATKYKGDALADDALWFAVTSAEKAKEPEEAKVLIEQLVREYPQGDMCAEANFRLAYDFYRAGEYAQAAERFGKAALGPCTQDHVATARAYYWQGRAQARAEQDAKEALTLAYKASPLSHYGMLARLRLESVPEITPPVKEPVVGPPSPGPVLPVERVRALTKVGLYAEAQAEVTAAKPSEDSPEYAALLAEAHEYHKAHFPYRKGMRPLLGSYPHDRAMWDVAYPRPFEVHIRRAEIEEKLPRDLLLSLVREESAFQVDAGSWANAFGLTQLLVETAVRTAADCNFPKTPSADLLKHEGISSLKLGAHLLSMLYKRYRSVPLVLAAYNAGEDVVDHWTRSRGYMPLDEFIEEIPIDETRGYVKRILWTWNVYRQLGEKKELPVVSLGRAFKPLTLASE